MTERRAQQVSALVAVQRQLESVTLAMGLTVRQIERDNAWVRDMQATRAAMLATTGEER